MTQYQQQSLISYINLLINRSTPPTNAMVHYFIKEITGIDVGKNYITQFWYKYSDILVAKYLKPIDLPRKKANNIYLYGLYFDTLKAKTKEYKIQPGNMYNMDKEGFFIGYLNNLH